MTAAPNTEGEGQALVPGPRVRRIDGREVVFDGEDFLADPDAWSESLALALAREAGLPGLDDVQWRVVKFLREYYYTHGRAPLNRQLREGAGLSLLELESLFPGGIQRGARRLAGLPNPKTCQ
ncbi:MAG: TusE/DsrC/DsvC family sulfur relay protein [Pseudomonadota bacterium]